MPLIRHLNIGYVLLLITLPGCSSTADDTRPRAAASAIAKVKTNTHASINTPIPYYSQLENQNKPASTCSVTSLAMVTDFFGITQPSDTARVPDKLYQRYGLLQDVPVLSGAFNQLALEAGSTARATGLTNGTFAQLQQHVSKGLPAIVHGWFTPPGHILVVIGYDGEYYTVHDPYGKWDLTKFGGYDTSVSGKNIRYPKAEFEHAINDNGSGDDLWLHLFAPQAAD